MKTNISALGAYESHSFKTLNRGIDSLENCKFLNLLAVFISR